MPIPELTVVAEDDLPSGEHWIVRAGGSAEDYYTFIETVHPDGHRDEGGMGGPLLHPGSYLNTYTGGSDQGLRRVLIRSDPRVRRVRLHLDTGEQRDLRPAGHDPAFAVSFFAALIPWAVSVVALQALDADGQVLQP